MKRRLTYLFLTASAVLAWHGCSSDHRLTATNRSVPIIFGNVTVNKGELTRATMGADVHNTGLPYGSRIDVFIYNSAGTPVPTDNELQGNPQAELPIVYVTTENPDPEMAQSALNREGNSQASPKYPSNDDANIFAVWPAMTSGSSPYTFTIQSDQRSAANVTASDLLATDRIVQPEVGGKAIDLPMTHCMAKVIVKFNATGNLTAANMPDEYSVLGVKNSVTIDPQTAATSSGRGAITTNSGTSNLSCSTAEAFLIPPQTVAAGATFLQFDIKGTVADHLNAISGATFKPTAAIEFQANTVYEITVNVNIDYITATATITPWNTEDMTFDKVIL